MDGWLPACAGMTGFFVMYKGFPLQSVVNAEKLIIMCSDITLVAFSMHQTKALVSMETASWYNKKGELTFSDIIAIVRRSIWSNKYFSKSENQLYLDKCSEEKINSLIYQLTLAA